MNNESEAQEVEKKETMEELSKMWDEGAKLPQTNNEPPDGKYTVEVERVSIETAKTTGNKYLNWGLKIIGENSQSGRYLWKKNMLTSAENMAYLRRDLEKIGCKLEKFTDFNPEAMLDMVILVERVTKPSRIAGKDPFVNINFLGLPKSEVEKEDPSF